VILPVRRHHLNLHVTQLADAQQVFELMPQHSATPDGTPQRDLLLDEGERGLGSPGKDLLPRQARGQKPLQIVLAVRGAPHAEQGPCVLLGLQQAVDVVIAVRPQLNRLGFEPGQVPYLLGVASLGDIALHRRQLALGTEHFVSGVQKLRPGQPPTAFDGPDLILAVPHGLAQLGLRQPRRVPPQLHLPRDGLHDGPGVVLQPRVPPGLVGPVGRIVPAPTRATAAAFTHGCTPPQCLRP
jgi:hypothetical protein